MIIFIAFILDGILSNVNFFVLTISSLVVSSPYIKVRKFYLISFIVGLLYDICYTDTIFLNAFVFLLLAYVVKKLNKFFPFNFINTLLIDFIIILLYRTITYFLLSTTYYLNFDFNLLLESIYLSLLYSFIFVSIFYYVKRYYKVM